MMDFTNPNDPWMQTGYDPFKGMNDKDRWKYAVIQVALFLIAVALGMIVCALFSGCTTTQYVPVIEHRIDTVLQNHTKHDSIYVHDSISVKEKGDTFLMERWHTKYALKEIHDTTYIATHDTIPQPYHVAADERKDAGLTWWQQTRMNIGSAVLIVLFGLLCWWIGGKLHSIKERWTW